MFYMEFCANCECEDNSKSLLIINMPRSENEPTIVAKKTEAATQKSQYMKFG